MFAPVLGDPYRDSVVLHLPMTGENNSTTFTDVSPFPKTITRVGNTKISTTQSKWGAGSGYFDGNGDYLTLPTSSAFEFGTGDFTIEAWFYLTGYTIAQSGLYRGILVGQPESFECRLQGTASSWTHLRLNLIGSSTVTPEVAYGFQLNQWYHVAAVRTSGNVTLYLDGTALVTASAAVANATVSDPVCIGGLSVTNYGYFFPGYLQDLRITKGVARYTASFTPPAGPLPARLPDCPVQQIQQSSFHTVARLGL